MVQAALSEVQKKAEAAGAMKVIAAVHLGIETQPWLY